MPKVIVPMLPLRWIRASSRFGEGFLFMALIHCFDPQLRKLLLYATCYFDVKYKNLGTRNRGVIS